MCAVSMVTQHYQDLYPIYQTFPVQFYPDYSELIRKAKLYDEMMAQKDCPDPVKEKWHADLTEFMEKTYGLKAK